jgi:hypothetical protein
MSIICFVFPLSPPLVVSSPLTLTRFWLSSFENALEYKECLLDKWSGKRDNDVSPYINDP